MNFEGYIPPQATDIEEAILACLLIELDAYSVVVEQEGITEEMFYKNTFKIVFKAIREIHAENKPIDLLTVYEKLKANGELETVGGNYGISSITSKVALGVNLQFYCKVVKQKYLERKVIELCQKCCNDVYSGDYDIFDTLFSLSEETKAMQEFGTDKNASRPLSEIHVEASKDLYKRVENHRNGKPIGINTGLTRLNQITGGWQNSDLIILGARPGIGKALRMDAKILTPSGWCLNKDLKIGDEVCSIDGKKSFIKGIFPQGFLKTYIVNFSDGRKIECCGSHLWQVNSCKFHKNATRVISTLELIELLKTDRYKNRISIPLFSGIFGEKKDFLIHPYLLGILLGDGCLTKGVMWNKPDLFIANKIEKLITDDYFVNQKVGNNFSIVIKSKKGNPLNKYKIELERLSLFGKKSFEKFIPFEYLDCVCREQRLELLNGILDSDGDCGKNEGSVNFSTSSEQLAKDVVYLCHSLGFKCSKNKRSVFLNGEQKKDNFRLIISTHDSDCFTLPRKHDRERKNNNKPLIIRSIFPTNKFVECQCISVTHHSSLYITDDFIVTHNTAMALYWAKCAAIAGKSVALFELEMSDVRLFDRLTLSETNVRPEDYRNGKLSDDELKEIEEATGRLEKLPIYVDSSANMTIQKISARCRILKNKGKCDLIIIDYLQLTSSGTDTNKNRNREQEVSAMSRQCKIIAKELNVPVILLSQLNRGLESRSDKRPMLSDLRESGAIEQDADMVIFIYRDEYYNDSAVKGCGELIIDKYRDGEVGVLYFGYNPSMTKICEWDGMTPVYDAKKQQKVPTIKIKQPEIQNYYEPKEYRTYETF
ncbi:hypothetical protein FACS1894195_0510 [Bacteroidia bacterium]|nr:hypothetical protein FACS1894195_0510 [Bacteroidia bacterium]